MMPTKKGIVRQPRTGVATQDNKLIKWQKENSILLRDLLTLVESRSTDAVPPASSNSTTRRQPDYA